MWSGYTLEWIDRLRFRHYLIVLNMHCMKLDFDEVRHCFSCCYSYKIIKYPAKLKTEFDNELLSLHILLKFRDRI